MGNETARWLADARSFADLGGPALVLVFVRRVLLRRGRRGVLRLQTDDQRPLDVVVTTAGKAESVVGPSGFTRYTTGFGQVVGLATCASRLKTIYPRKTIRVQFSEHVTDPSHDLIILGGLDGNEYASRLVEEFREAFGDSGAEWFHYDDRGTTEVVLGSAKYVPFDLRIENGVVRQDLGIVIFWRNFLSSEWRRAVLCYGFTSYGTAEASRFAFETVTPISLGSLLRPTRAVRLVRRHVRRTDSCVICVVLARFGADQTPEGPPALVAACAFRGGQEAEQLEVSVGARGRHAKCS